MAVKINTRFNPLRLVLSRREPVEMTIEVTNKENKDSKLTVKLAAPPELSFGKGGYKNVELQRVDDFKAGKTTKLFFKIYSNQKTEQGIYYPLTIKVQEHGTNYASLLNETIIEEELKVE